MNWHWINWIVIFIYFLGVVGIGVYFSKKNESTADYFKGGGKIPAWVTACSIYATALSSLSFMAIPASVFKNGWIMGMAPLGIILMVLWSAKTFVKFFRNLEVETAYEYLEKRFDRKFRVIGSITFIIFHIIRIAIILYLPILALTVALPTINPMFLVGIVGFLCVTYTSMGGIKAVLWSDAIQTIVLLFGALVITISGVINLPEGIGVFSALNAADKIITPDMFSLNFSGKTLIGIIIGGFLSSIYAYVGSQDIVQRYSTTKNLKEAQKSLYMNIPLLLTSILIFVGMGSGLFLFFTYSAVLPENISGNSILPYFVINYIPTGLSGLVIAAIFAATQSTVSSSLNSVSICIASDLIKPLYKVMDDKLELKVAKRSSWIVGLISSMLAFRFLSVGQGDMFLYFQSITGLLGGPIAGLFLVGIFIKKATSREAWIGFITSILVGLYISNPMGVMNILPGYSKPEIFEFLTSLVVIGSCVVPSWMFSLL
ncbi:MAG: sodium:solute symporter, partial [Fusobacteriaceae bacterium]